MLGVDGASKECGQLREGQVYMGSRRLGLSGARYVPPPETHASVGILRPSRLGGRRKLHVAWELMDLLTRPAAATRESQVQKTIRF